MQQNNKITFKTVKTTKELIKMYIDPAKNSFNKVDHYRIHDKKNNRFKKYSIFLILPIYL